MRLLLLTNLCNLLSIDHQMLHTYSLSVYVAVFLYIWFICFHIKLGYTTYIWLMIYSIIILKYYTLLCYIYYDDKVSIKLI